MKIVYFHGFASSGATGTAQLLRRILPEDEVIAPDIPMDLEEALPFLREFCATEKPDLIIGTSMGRMYAQQMHGFRKHYPYASRFEGGHQLNEHALRTAVLPLIKTIKNE